MRAAFVAVAVVPIKTRNLKIHEINMSFVHTNVNLIARKVQRRSAFRPAMRTRRRCDPY
jgi:hypothetical protein